METSNLYEISQNYWNTIPPTLHGMLGGYEHISHIDINTSKRFLKRLYKNMEIGKALDCGAGIGRVSKYLLLPLCYNVDLVESNQTFLDEAKNYLDNNKKIENYFHSGLESFYPSQDTYDLIWCQWVLTHLDNEDLINFLKRAKLALKDNAKENNLSFIIVKENVTSSVNIRDYDSSDGSITRPREEFLQIFEMAGLKIVEEQLQPKFPSDLYKVIMFALK